jgi:hypothetical protein
MTHYTNLQWVKIWFSLHSARQIEADIIGGYLPCTIEYIQIGA